VKTQPKLDWLMIGLVLVTVTALIVLALAEPVTPDGPLIHLATQTPTVTATAGWWDAIPTPSSAAPTAVQITPEVSP